MKHQLLAYGIVGLLSIGAGVAIAGLPNNVPVDATIIPPTRTGAPEPTLATTTVPESTVPDTTEPEATTLPATLPPTTLPPPERALVPVVVSSGPSNGQRIAPEAVLLASVGWTDIRPLTGSVALTDTVVFYVDGLRAAAELLAVDAGLPVTSVAPTSDAPPVAGLANAQLLFYFGGA